MIPVTFVAGLLNHATFEDGTPWGGGATPYRKDLPGGSVEWANGQDGTVACLRHTCPCGCGVVGQLHVKPGYGTTWNWDGNREKPTLMPSVQMLCPCGWHGYLTNGIWKSC